MLCSVVKHRRLYVHNVGKIQHVRSFSGFVGSLFLVYNTLIVTFFQELGVMESCLMITCMTSRIHSVVFSSVHLRSLASTPLKHTDFLFLSLVNSSLCFSWSSYFSFFFETILYFSCSEFPFSIFSRIALILGSSVGVLVVVFFHRSYLSTDLRKTLQMCLQTPLLDASMSPTSFLMRVIRNLSFLS